MAQPHVQEAPTSSLPGPSIRTVSLFVRMWAVAHVIHLTANSGGRLDSPWNVTVVSAAVVLLLRPTSGRFLALMAAAQVVDTVVELPFSPDHWMLIAFVNLALLLTMARRRSWGVEATAAAFPAARTIVLVGYSAAALAKYNTAFLDPVASCAGAIAKTASFGLTAKLDAGPVWVASVLVMETSIPLLLAIPATRRHGVRVAMAFHFVLSASPAFAVVDFTAALFALFILFLSERDVGTLLSRINWFASRSAIVRDARRVPWLTAVVAFVVFGFCGYASLRVGASLVFLASELYLFFTLVAALTSWRAGCDVRPFGRLLLVQVPAVVLLALWICQPYLGGRTAGVLTMFSGIRTEGEAPNHVFLPSYRLADWQEDFVVLESSNAPELEDIPKNRLGVPLLALRRMAMDDPDLVVVGTMGGRRITFGPGPRQHHLEPLPWWQRKWLLFRPVAVGDKRFCTVS